MTDPGARATRGTPHERALGVALAASVWAPLLVLGVVALVSASGLGAAWPRFDAVAHFAGGAAVAHASACALGHLQRVVGPTPRPVRLAAAVGFAAVAAIAWELAEYAADRLAGTHWVEDLADTLSDLGLGLAGALVFALGAGLRRPR